MTPIVAQVLLCLTTWWGLAIYVISESKWLMQREPHLQTEATLGADTPASTRTSREIDGRGASGAVAHAPSGARNEASSSSGPPEEMAIASTPAAVDESTGEFRKEDRSSVKHLSNGPAEAAHEAPAAHFPFPLFLSAWANVVISVLCFLWRRLKSLRSCGCSRASQMDGDRRDGENWIRPDRAVPDEEFGLEEEIAAMVDGRAASPVGSSPSPPSARTAHCRAGSYLAGGGSEMMKLHPHYVAADEVETRGGRAEGDAGAAGDIIIRTDLESPARPKKIFFDGASAGAGEARVEVFRTSPLGNQVVGGARSRTGKSKSSSSSEEIFASRFFREHIFCIGILQGLEIGASNSSLYFLPLVVRTTMHSLTPLYMFFVCRFLDLEFTDNRGVLVAIFLCSFGGLFLCRQRATEPGQEVDVTAFAHLSHLGLAFGVAAPLFGCSRWAMMQRLLRGPAPDPKGATDHSNGRETSNYPELNVGDVLLFTSPITAAVLIALSVVFEPEAFAACFFEHSAVAAQLQPPGGELIDVDGRRRNPNLVEAATAAAGTGGVVISTGHQTEQVVYSDEHAFSIMATLTLLGMAITVMILAELRLLQLTSALTLCIFGVCHNVLIIVAGMLFFHEQLDGVQLLGVGVTQLGVLLYGISRTSWSGSSRGSSSVSKAEEYGIVRSGDDSDEGTQESVFCRRRAGGSSSVQKQKQLNPFSPGPVRASGVGASYLQSSATSTTRAVADADGVGTDLREVGVANAG